MILPINLTRTDGDGKLMNANNPLAPSPSYITYAQLRYSPFTSAQAIQGAFVSGSNSTVEFDMIGVNLTKYLKLFVSMNGTDYAEKKSWGGTDGIRQKECLQTLITDITQEGTDPPTGETVYDEIGLLDWDYNGAGSYDINFDISVAENLTPIFNAGESSIDRNPRAYWNGNDSKISLRAEGDDYIANATLLVIYKP